jgi:hypothetical protein
MCLRSELLLTNLIRAANSFSFFNKFSAFYGVQRCTFCRIHISSPYRACSLSQRNYKSVLDVIRFLIVFFQISNIPVNLYQRQVCCCQDSYHYETEYSYSLFLIINLLEALRPCWCLDRCVSKCMCSP